MKMSCSELLMQSGTLF